MEQLTTPSTKDVATSERPPPSKFDLLVQGLSEGFLLIYLTAISYICAYAFEFGFYSYFRLPVHFVSVELDDCLRAGFYISFAGLIAFSNANGFLSIATRIGICESKVRQFLGFLVVMIGIGWVLDYLFAWGYPLWIILGILVIILLVAFWTAPKKSNQAHNSTVKKNFDLIDSMFTVLGPKNFIIVLVGIVLFFVSFGLGKATAKREQEFFYLEGTDNVLLGTYRDSYILKEYDKSAKIWRSGAILLRADEAKEIQLRHDNCRCDT